MTTVISRLYESDSSAKAVVSGLAEAGFPDKTFETIENSDAAAMEAAGVDADALVIACTNLRTPMLGAWDRATNWSWSARPSCRLVRQRKRCALSIANRPSTQA